MPRPIDLKTVQIPRGILTPEIAAQIVAENEDLYHDQIYELEKEYGGHFVRDRALYDRLLRLTTTYVGFHGEEPKKALVLPDFPADNFYAIKLSFDVKMIGQRISKWYFIRSPRVFVLRAD